MTTTSEIVTRALRKIGVASEDLGANDTQIALGVDALNMMLSAWQLQGIDRAHTDLTSAETFPLDAKFERGVVFLLAADISPDYVIPRSFDVDDFMRQIQAAYMTIPTVAMPEPLKRMPSQYWPNPALRGYQTGSS